MTETRSQPGRFRGNGSSKRLIGIANWTGTTRTSAPPPRLRCCARGLRPGRSTMAWQTSTRPPFASSPLAPSHRKSPGSSTSARPAKAIGSPAFATSRVSTMGRRTGPSSSPVAVPPTSPHDRFRARPPGRPGCGTRARSVGATRSLACSLWLPGLARRGRGRGAPLPRAPAGSVQAYEKYRVCYLLVALRSRTGDVLLPWQGKPGRSALHFAVGSTCTCQCAREPGAASTWRWRPNRACG